MTKRILPLLVLVTAFSFAGPLVSTSSPTLDLETDTTSIDLTSVPMDDIEVISQTAVAPMPEALSVVSVRDAITAAAIATPEPATYGFAAVALLAAGTYRRPRTSRAKARN